MLIRDIKIINFRNYGVQSIILNSGINLFYGENGSGKTNIIEAIYWMAMTKSFRTNDDYILIKDGQNRMQIVVNASFEGINKEYSIEYDYFLRKKIIKINNNKLIRISNIVGEFPIVLFAPENIMIIKGDPSFRRNFIDELISKISNDYYQILLRYLKEIAHRNYLLRQIKENRVQKNVLDIWNKQITEDGTKILVFRNTVIEKLNHILNENLFQIKNRILLKYNSKIFDVLEPDMIKKKYEWFFKNNIDNEIARAITLIGPHRDDIEIFYNNKLSKQYASEGQQRITAILIKLAEGFIIKHEKDTYPIILLDDFSSELDNPNKNFIINTFDLFEQILITTTYKENFKNFKVLKEFEIKNGKIYE